MKEKLLSIRMKKGQDLRQFLEELTTLHAAVPHTTVGWDGICTILSRELRVNGYDLAYSWLLKERPTSLAVAANLICSLGSPATQAGASAAAAVGNGPAPMQIDAMQLDRGQVVNIVQDTVQTLVPTLVPALLGAMPLTQSRTGRDMTPPRMPRFGYNGSGRPDSAIPPRDRDRYSRGGYSRDNLQYNRDHSRGRSHSRDSHGRSMSRSRNDPMSDPRWPAGVVRSRDDIMRMAAAGQCYLCRSSEHPWLKCTDPRYRVQHSRPNGR
jgi:hypothetical protein